MSDKGAVVFLLNLFIIRYLFCSNKPTTKSHLRIYYFYYYFCSLWPEQPFYNSTELSIFCLSQTVPLIFLKKYPYSVWPEQSLYYFYYVTHMSHLNSPFTISTKLSLLCLSWIDTLLYSLNYPYYVCYLILQHLLPDSQTSVPVTLSTSPVPQQPGILLSFEAPRDLLAWTVPWGIVLGNQWRAIGGKWSISITANIWPSVL